MNDMRSIMVSRRVATDFYFISAERMKDIAITKNSRPLINYNGLQVRALRLATIFGEDSNTRQFRCGAVGYKRKSRRYWQQCCSQLGCDALETAIRLG
jgi:hypothetical protein